MAVLEVGTLTKAEANAAASRDDKAFLLIAIALEMAVQGKLDALTDDIKAAVNKYTRGGSLNDSTSLKSDVGLLLVGFWAYLSTRTADAVGGVADAKVKQAMSTVYKDLQSVGAFDEARTLRTELNNYAVDAEKALYSRVVFGETFNNRITTIREGNIITVRNIIDNGVTDGLSAKDIAKKLEQYVNPVPGLPKARPYDIYRERFGRPKSFTPRNVPAGTVQYNAIRIARTETARTYRTATVDFYKDKKYVQQFRWVLSNSHHEADICDFYASKKWKADNVPFSHPFCLCDVQPILSLDKVAK